MATRITTRFTAQSTAAEVVEGVDLTGKRVIVTGGGAGIGVETARACGRPPRRPSPADLSASA
jgi:FlaA1/EpsC-like NDP-sugar epimerase